MAIIINPTMTTSTTTTTTMTTTTTITTTMTTKWTILNVLLLLNSVVTTVQGAVFNSAHYSKIHPEYSYSYILKKAPHVSFNASTLLDCAWVSLNKQAEFFSYNRQSRLCVNYSPNNILTVTKVRDHSNQVAFYRVHPDEKWIRVYALSMGANSVILDSFLNQGNPTNWKVEKCLHNYCPNFFRHPIMDLWRRLPIEEVKIVLYKKKTPVANIVFNGRNSSINDWFTKARLKTSSWTDLVPGKPSQIEFGKKGYWRNLDVFDSPNIDCNVLKGWMAVVLQPSCQWDRSDFYPHIIYSEKQTVSDWKNDHAHANSFAVFLHLGKQ